MNCRFLLVLLLAPVAWTQTAPDMAAAPHYRQLLVNSQVRVFALTLRPLERTMARHDNNFLVIALYVRIRTFQAYVAIQTARVMETELLNQTEPIPKIAV